MLTARSATLADAARIVAIYNQGIEDRIATFETRLRTIEEVLAWFDDDHPVVVAEDVRGIQAFARSSSYRPRECYAGIAEFSIYVARDYRGRGAGQVAMVALIEAVALVGIWKLVSRVFVENTPSRAMLKRVGFREVGVYLKHARLDGEWRDVVIVERLIAANL